MPTTTPLINQTAVELLAEAQRINALAKEEVNLVSRAILKVLSSSILEPNAEQLADATRNMSLLRKIKTAAVAAVQSSDEALKLAERAIELEAVVTRIMAEKAAGVVLAEETPAMKLQRILTSPETLVPKPVAVGAAYQAKKAVVGELSTAIDALESVSELRVVTRAVVRPDLKVLLTSRESLKRRPVGSDVSTIAAPAPAVNSPAASMAPVAIVPAGCLPSFSVLLRSLFSAKPNSPINQVL